MSRYKKRPEDIMWLKGSSLCFDADLGEFLQEESFDYDSGTVLTMQEFAEFWECVELWWEDLQHA
jgi:hypothetical protein